MKRPVRGYDPEQPGFICFQFDGILQASAPETYPGFTAPKDIEILSVKLHSDTALAADAANYWTLSLQAPGGGTTYASLTNETTAWDATAGNSLTVGTADVAKDALVEATLVSTAGTPGDLDGHRFSVTVEYTWR